MGFSSFSYCASIINNNTVYHYDSFWHKKLDHWLKISDLISNNDQVRLAKKCQNIKCELAIHTNAKKGNRGKHCCRACKLNNGHGPLCEQLKMPPSLD